MPPSLSRRAVLGGVSLLAILAIFALFVVANPRPNHPLVGAWLATDETVFVFRDDGTFIGRDFRNRRIFGNWTRLDARTIGFQSLLHKGFYNPQFAIVTPAGMKYALSDGDGFIPAVRISDSRAQTDIDKSIPLPAPTPGD